MEVVPVPEDFPLYAYNAKPFDVLQSRVGDNTILSDVVGVVNKLTYIIPSKTNQELRRHVYLKDARDKLAIITLWGEHAEDFDAEGLHQASCEDNIIVLFVGMTIGQFSGMLAFKSTSLTRWYTNIPIPEMDALRARLSSAAATMMATEAPHDGESPSSSSSTNNQLWARAQDTPRVIQVPCRMLLDLMLQKLGISDTEYRLEFCEDNKVHMTVIFTTSALTLEGSPMRMIMSGEKSSSYETAEDTACTKAISYIAKATNTVIKDFNYARMKYLEAQNKKLQHELKRSYEYKKQLARGWFLAVTHVFLLSAGAKYCIH